MLFIGICHYHGRCFLFLTSILYRNELLCSIKKEEGEIDLLKGNRGKYIQMVGVLLN